MTSKENLMTAQEYRAKATKMAESPYDLAVQTAQVHAILAVAAELAEPREAIERETASRRQWRRWLLGAR